MVVSQVVVAVVIKEFLNRSIENMVEILQWLFVTERDQMIYSSKQKLIKEMIEEYDFDEIEVIQAMSWFEPIRHEYLNLSVDKSIVREFSEWEKRVVPQQVIDKVLMLEFTKVITSQEREILFDRLGELCLDYAIETDDMDVIFNGLLSHMKNYGETVTFNNAPTENTYYWLNNTVH